MPVLPRRVEPASKPGGVPWSHTSGHKVLSSTGEKKKKNLSFLSFKDKSDLKCSSTTGKKLFDVQPRDLEE